MRLHELIGLKSEWDFKGTHEEYYGAIVKVLGYDDVASCVPYDIETLDKAMKVDRHFNSLSMKAWDLASGFICSGIDCRLVGSRLTNIFRKHGVNVYSNAQGVCVLKECAREMVEAYRKERKYVE